MTSLRHVLPAATVALGLWAAALPACAAVFADFDPDTNGSDLRWVRDATGTGGALFSIMTNSATSAQGVATHFSYLDPALSALVFLPATFTLSADVVATPAINDGGGMFTQDGVTGSFSFIYSGPTTVIGGHTLTQGVTNLLSGVFTNAWMQGAGASGSANLSAPTGSAVYTSDLENLVSIAPGSEAFAFNLLDATPGFTASGCPVSQGVCTKALSSFRANGGGNFSAIPIPEPSAWLLMIAGFGGLGASLRIRRRKALAA
jgi:hypothetical protein